MWQFQWILNLIPENILIIIYYSLLLIGILTYIGSKLLKYIPFKSIIVVCRYPILFEIVSILLIASGCYLLGGYGVDMAWRAKAEQMQAEIAKSEEKSKEVNVAIEQKAKQKIKIIREKGIIVKQYIDREVTKYDNTCVIPKEFIKAHNDSAEAPK